MVISFLVKLMSSLHKYDNVIIGICVLMAGLAVGINIPRKCDHVTALERDHQIIEPCKRFHSVEFAPGDKIRHRLRPHLWGIVLEVKDGRMRIVYGRKGSGKLTSSIASKFKWGLVKEK